MTATPTPAARRAAGRHRAGGARGRAGRQPRLRHEPATGAHPPIVLRTGALAALTAGLAGTTVAEASLVLVEAMPEILDDLVDRHGQAGDDAWSAAVDTASAILLQERVRRSA